MINGTKLPVEAQLVAYRVCRTNPSLWEITLAVEPSHRLREEGEKMKAAMYVGDGERWWFSENGALIPVSDPIMRHFLPMIFKRLPGVTSYRKPRLVALNGEPVS